MTPEQLMKIARQVCTVRELEVLELMSRGLGYRRIAVLLDLDPSTVRDTFKRAARKLRDQLGLEALR